MSISGWPSPADAHALADVEHGCLVSLALADDDGAAHLDLVKGVPHGLGRGTVGGMAVAATHVARRGDGRRFGDPHHFEGEEGLHGVSGGSGGGR